MLRFENDYAEGAHEQILRRLIETNLEQAPGYGNDKYCESAREKICATCECPEAQVHFLVGGTQTNSVVIATMLRDYEGVISAYTGHVNQHEAGAIEYTGHKVIGIGHKEGKINAKDVKKCLTDFWGDGSHEHMVFPGMVYISHPTEYGTLYTRQELAELSEVCKEYQIPLFIDGARLGYGLMSRNTDVSLADVAKYCDVFYIGGTKVGALCGEAVVFTRKNAPRYFMTMVKQHGAMLAKGRLLGIQFDTLFTDNLYFDIGRHAIDMAEKLKEVLCEAGLPFYLNSPTNQQFVVIEDEKLAKLQKEVAVCFWEKPDETHTVVRFATSWATKEEDIEALREILLNL